MQRANSCSGDIPPCRLPTPLVTPEPADRHQSASAPCRLLVKKRELALDEMVALETPDGVGGIRAIYVPAR
jgi:hypothetical protein